MAIIVQATLANIMVETVFNQHFKKMGLFNGGVEISGGGYTRASVPSFVYVSADDDYFYYANTTLISFPKASSNWGSVGQIGFFDTNGDLLCIMDLYFTIVVSAGDTLIFYPNTLILSIPKEMR
jgi:hypothetical protein